MTAALARKRASTNRDRSGSVGRTRAVSRPTAVGSRANMVRPQLKVLDQQTLRARARRRNVAMTMFIVLIIGFFAAALAQAQLVANQHQLDQLHSRVAEAEAERARLERAVDESSAPSSIIAQAQELGMIRASEPVYLAAVSDAADITPIAVLGSVTASTAGASAESVQLEDAESESALASADLATDEVAAAPSGDAGSQGQLAAPVIASIAGTRAVATGIGTG